jgi:hypothetical protein
MNHSKSYGSSFVRLTQFGGFNLTSIIILAVITLGLWGSPRVEPQIIVNTPAGLVPGDTFRIAFATDSTTTATSTNIADYNAFVNADATTEAGGGSVTYYGTALSFSAIGSTAAVNAISNIGQTGAPVYLINGTEVASSDTAAAGGLWSGTLLNPIFLDLNSDSPLFATNTDLVWTGTSTGGLSAGVHVLGGATPATGVDGSSNLLWTGGPGFTSSSRLLLYGISQPLSVVPEPASIVLCLSAAGCGVVGVYVGRRRAITQGR